MCPHSGYCMDIIYVHTVPTEQTHVHTVLTEWTHVHIVDLPTKWTYVHIVPTEQ